MNFLETKTIHFIGIGGIGVSALARLFSARGAKVSGSDRVDFAGSEDLKKRGVEIHIGHQAGNVPAETEAVIYSPAVPEDNPEFAFARQKGIPLFDYVEALGKIMEEKYGVAVSGTNGKTTTTAILGKIIEKAGFDPLVIVGGKVPGWDNNLRLPKDRSKKDGTDTAPEEEKQREEFPYNIFIAEACEYRRNMLKLRPKTIVLTNLEPDHLDYYKDLDDLKNAFTEYVKNLPDDGILVYNADDPSFVEMAEQTNARKVSFSLKTEADVSAYGLTHGLTGQVFRLRFEKEELGVFTLPVPGVFNVYNAVAAVACAIALGVPETVIREALLEFHGTWRRFETVGAFHGKPVVSDYAHHPTSVRFTLEAAKELYAGKKVFVVFQPHQKDRTLKMLSEFASALSTADGLLIAEIYEVAGRNDVPQNISSRDLVKAIEDLHENLSVGYAKDIAQAEKIVRDIADPYDVILVMGAGDIHKVAEHLAKG